MHVLRVLILRLLHALPCNGRSIDLFTSWPAALPVAPAQFYIKTFTKGGEEQAERCLSHFPHPYPSLRGLQVRAVWCAAH